MDECGLKEKPVVTDLKGFLLSRGEVTYDRFRSAGSLLKIVLGAIIYQRTED